MESLWTDLLGGEYAQRYYDAAGIRTRCLEAGRGGEALICLHGAGGHAETYTRNLLPHAEHFRVISLDMLGHGFTDKPDRDYEIRDYVEHLRAFLDAAGIERAHLTGESLGGWVAAQFAIDYPARVGRLVLNTAGGLTAYPEVMERLRTLSLAAVENASRESVRKRLEFLMKDQAAVTDDLVETRYRIYTQPGFLRAMEHILCLQLMDIRQRNLLDREQLRGIHCSALVVWTTHDPTAPVEVGQEFANLIPDARFEVMADCGHWPQWEDAARFNDLQLAFLRGG